MLVIELAGKKKKIDKKDILLLFPIKDKNEVIVVCKYKGRHKVASFVSSASHEDILSLLKDTPFYINREFLIDIVPEESKITLNFDTCMVYIDGEEVKIEEK